MSACTACHAQIVQATGDQHDHVRKAVSRVAKLVFGNPADFGYEIIGTYNFDARNRMFDADACARQFAIVALLAKC